MLKDKNNIYSLNFSIILAHKHFQPVTMQPKAFKPNTMQPIMYFIIFP